MKRIVLALPLLALVAALASGCGDGDYVASAAPSKRPAKTCPKAWLAGWQALADRIGSPVYCPTWMPSPLDAAIDGSWNTVDSVDPDGSYLVGFAWQERAEEVHVNFRGYPGRTRVPRCVDTTYDSGKTHRRQVPCFSDARGTKRFGATTVTMYTVNRDADQWHVLYAWRANGSLYAISEHISPPLTFARVVRNLDRMMQGIAVVRPRT